MRLTYMVNKNLSLFLLFLTCDAVIIYVVPMFSHVIVDLVYGPREVWSCYPSRIQEFTPGSGKWMMTSTMAPVTIGIRS